MSPDPDYRDHYDDNHYSGEIMKIITTGASHTRTALPEKG